MAITKLGRTVILVEDPDEALEFYRDRLGFSVIFDGDVGEGIRAVHVGPSTQPNVGLWLLQAEGEQRDLVGRQTGGHPTMVFYTDDCVAAFKELSARGVRFRGEPARNGPDTVVFFEDLYGNPFVLVELGEARFEPA